MAVDPMHGTHVAGIIGASRDNNVGVRGVGRQRKDHDGTEIASLEWEIEAR